MTSPYDYPPRSTSTDSTTPVISNPYPLGSIPTPNTSEYYPSLPRGQSHYTPHSQRPSQDHSRSPNKLHKPHPSHSTSSSTTHSPQKNKEATEMVLSPGYKKREDETDEERELDEEEKAMLKKGMINWRELRSWRFWIRKEWIWWYLALVVILVLVALMTLYNKEIIAWMQPFAEKLKDLKFGWLIPVAILFVISFPPLFGQEIVGVLVGVVWGLWIGFAIVAVGSFLGEMGNYYAFKYLFRKKAEKMERKNLNYGLLAYVIREGGLVMATVVRLSAIPGHFSTVVFSTCGLSVWIFIISTILSMPKQILVVYLGVALKNTEADTKTKVIQNVVLALSFLVTVLAAWYIYWKMNKARLYVWRKHRADLAATGMNMDEIPKDPTQYRPGDFEGGKGGRRELEEEELDDARSPMLDKDKEGKAKRQPSYLNSFDISYKRNEDGMSVYGVDDVPNSSTQLPLKANEYRNEGPVERSPPIGSSTHHDPFDRQEYLQHGPSGGEGFPTARPAQLAPGQTKRESVVSLLPPSGGGYLDPPIQTQGFPIPAAPSPSNSSTGSHERRSPGNTQGRAASHYQPSSHPQEHQYGLAGEDYGAAGPAGGEGSYGGELQAPRPVKGSAAGGERQRYSLADPGVV